MTFTELPEILSAMHVANYLGISRRKVYELMDLKTDFGGIPNFAIGASRRIRKERFAEWLQKLERG